MQLQIILHQHTIHNELHGKILRMLRNAYILFGYKLVGFLLQYRDLTVVFKYGVIHFFDVEDSLLP
ncbi:hypothetical protein D3C86_1989700 [compost metagenome]